MTASSQLGLTNYKRVGVIDIGSNSVRFVVYSISGAAFAPIYDEKVLAGLGRDLRRTGKLNQQGRKQALEALKRFSALAKAQNLDDVLIAATAAMRDASDAPEFIARVKQDTGLDILPLSGEIEALMSARGVIAGEPRAKGLAVDLGGASLELVQVSEGRASGGVSYQLGPFSMFDGIFDPTELRPHIEAILGANIAQSFPHIETLYLIGGAWRNLAIIEQKRNGYPLRVAHNYSFGTTHARDLAKWACSEEGTAELMSWPNISQRRADTLPYAGLMLSVLLDKLNPAHVVIAPGGLRDGLVYQWIGADAKNRDALFDACASIAGQSTEDAEMAAETFRFLSGIQADLPRTFALETEDRIRKAASFLIGIGAGLHPDHRAKIVYEIALYGPLPGLTHKERAYLALMLFRSFRSRKKPPDHAVIQELLSESEQMNATIYGKALRASIVLGGRSAEVLQNYSVALDANAMFLSVQRGSEDIIIERITEHFKQFADMLGVTLHLKKA
jgi:exopolyphosphatase / guanosine-5'-triphosphate,3'-diphosphate pyrophosphatase